MRIFSTKVVCCRFGSKWQHKWQHLDRSPALGCKRFVAGCPENPDLVFRKEVDFEGSEILLY
jgi:hypothetical protein